MPLASTEVTIEPLEAPQPPVQNWPRLPIEPIPGPMEAQAFVSPDCSYAVLKNLVDAAAQRILLYIYNVSAEHMLDLLRAALQRGVDLRIMYDATDTRADEVDKLQALAGATVKVAPSRNPRRAFTVCHQKYLVIDDRVVVVGSSNWATTSVPRIADPQRDRWKKGNREWFIAMRSAPAARAFTALFDLDWAFEPAPEEVVALPEQPALVGLALTSLEAAVPERRFLPRSVEVPGGVEFVPILSPQNYLEEVLALLRSARRSVSIEQQYIKALGDDRYVPELLEAVAGLPASVGVRIITSSAFDRSFRETLQTLQLFGLEDRVRAINLDLFTHCHNKGVIVDGRIALVSSTNWSENSIGAAREAGVLIRDEHLSRYFQEVFDFDWESGWTTEEAERALQEIVPEVSPPADEELHPADLA